MWINQGYLLHKRMKSMNISAVIGAQYWLLPNMFAEIRYNMGLTDINDGMPAIFTPGDNEIKTQAINFGVGYKF